MDIKELTEEELVPMNLLLLADPSKQIVEEYVKRGRCFTAQESGEVAGVYVLLPTRPGTVELVNIAVLEAYQGQGTGRALVLHAVNEAKKAAFKTLEVGTGNSSIGQLALYQKCGFRIAGVDRDYFVKHYPEPIVENGILCRDMIRLSLDLQPQG
ncbi:MAG: GNAT family N-acetyltransferase [Alkalicoccus sp.]|nr:MAG: GNAT family N-acetyltransferase [Alkalicoccus sp.]